MRVLTVVGFDPVRRQTDQINKNRCAEGRAGFCNFMYDVFGKNAVVTICGHIFLRNICSDRSRALRQSTEIPALTPALWM